MTRRQGRRHKAEGRSVERTIACPPSSRAQLASVSRFLTFAFCLLPFALTGSSQAPQFHAGTDVVSIYATVVDKDGRLVTDLRREDFVVTDNGRTQKLAFFTNDVQPFTAVILLDRSGSMSDHGELPVDAVAAFVRQMLPADRARIGSFSDDIRIDPPEFTSDHRLLMGVVENDLVGPGASPVWTAIDRSISALVPQPGRRVVLVLTDGHDSPLLNQQPTRLDRLMERARTADVMIYSIGFAAVGTQIRSSQDPRSRLPFGIPVGRSGPVTSRGALLTKSAEPPDPALKDLAEASGGGYFELEDEKNDLRATFAKVIDELHRQYWLGFVPVTLDGKVHEIDVRVKRRGAEVRARRHYVAGAGR